MALFEEKVTLINGVKLAIVLLLLISIVKPHEAIRVPDNLKLKQDRATMEVISPQDHSETPKMGPNPCSYTPNPSAGHCNHP
ncbi:hypothetical protein COLO4_05584 [Corchorus olitorius]|uniref:Transmembrane protein n=1 Tax=Corchorus olitorius TaxID=93759 RepID=A0A1R3KQI5_9ROSI|nr:hypothetical protein COLO4_05584 [Corchorus olitorius]